MTREQRIQKARDAVVRAAETWRRWRDGSMRAPCNAPEMLNRATEVLRAAERTPKPPRKARAR